MVRVAEGADSGLRDAQGAVMAPCIVMEKGEALDVWIQNSGEKIDLFTGLQAHPPPPACSMRCISAQQWPDLARGRSTCMLRHV